MRIPIPFILRLNFFSDPISVDVGDSAAPAAPLTNELFQVSSDFDDHHNFRYEICFSSL